ncbi:MAG TPA: flagellar basal body L-ring protein FlgH [Tepidisphaeraceae bacterium]|jgi:flagellar L-ring protein precursor FlgH
MKSVVTTVSFGLIASTALAQTAPPMTAPTVQARRVTPQSSVPAGPPANISELMRQNGGSLRRAALQMNEDPRTIKPADVNYFAVPEPKPKTLLKHDLVTIIVSEQSQFSSDGTVDTQKEAGIDAKLEQFPSFSFENFALKNTIGAITPQIKASASRDYKGEGTVDRKDTFTARIQAEVVDVKPNGTLVLQARKRIKTDEEEQLIVLNGIARVQDITPDNTVLSTQLFDMDVRKSHRGAVREATKRGWVPRLLDWVNPF